MVQFLKKMKDLQPKHSVKYLLHKHLNSSSPGRPFSRLHASELTKPEGLCPRMYALADITHAKPKDEWLDASSAMTFQIGRDQEKNIVHWFADMDKAICHWKCIACGTLHEFQPRPTACKTCGVKRFDHKEIRFESADNSASCGIDMVVGLGEPKYRAVELKTIDKEQFKELKAPLAEHKWRTELYLRLISESDHPFAKKVNTQVATILYVSKGGFGCADDQLKKWGLYDNFSPFKEFEIKRNDASVESLAKRAKVVKDFRDGKVGMPAGLCPTAFCKRAGGCPVKSQCFSGEYPPEYDWKA
ncbi:hypothetical protein [Hyphomicrobium sp. ghe19]|uniref:hypothetical protein n=1 Tax=Hyphomicrobium sp. ghe19 TaxID=2682968 RepID=UPI0013669C8E|nr:hypothetical protein HYPP_02461 [Hyphomicrobium sp. ghe19]